MYYEINVALHGNHFFATAERSIRDMIKLKQVYSSFKDKFPESEGFSIYVTKREIISKSVDKSELE